MRANRHDDILVTPDGRPLGRLDPACKGMSRIYETQIVQNSPDTLLFKMVVDPTFTRDTRDELLYEVKKRTGPDMSVNIELVDEIPKDKNGRFWSVITNI